MIENDYNKPTFFVRAVHGVMLFLTVFQSVFSGVVYAQITPDSAAPAANQASIINAPNGVPVVNIVAPNASGLSHNQFTDYNVGSNGVVLNNSQNFGVSNLAGAIAGNPNLSGGNLASVILNEVTSTNTSVLNGFTEVFGQAADVIVSNPNGLTCQGCGFLNTPRVTLTTGTPQLDINGALDNLSINGGTIFVQGAGLDATSSNSKVDILARAIEVNGELHAEELNLVTGRNDYNLNTDTATPKADDASIKPSLGLDSSALGGMYAGKITLIGTEAGVGYRLAGDMASSVSDLTINADGSITLSGDTVSQTQAAITSQQGDIDIDDANLYAQTNLNITASNGRLTTTAGSLIAANDALQITAHDMTVESAATVAGGYDGAALRDGGSLTLSINDGAQIDGEILSGADLTLNASSLINQGLIFASNDLDVTLTGAFSNIASAQLQANNHITLDVQDFSNAGTISASQNNLIQVRSTNTTSITTSGRIITGNNLTFEASNLVNAGTISAAQNILLTTVGGGAATSLRVEDNGTISSSAGNVTIDASSQNFADDAFVSAFDTLTLDGATITLSDNAALLAGFDISGATLRDAAGLLLLTATIQLDNNGGLLLSAQDIQLESDRITNRDSGAIQASRHLILSGLAAGYASVIENISALISTLDGDLTLRASQVVNEVENVTVTQTEDEIIYDEYFSLSGSSHPGCNSIPGKTISGAGCGYFGRGNIAFVPHPFIGDSFGSYYSGEYGGSVRSYVVESRNEAVITGITPYMTAGQDLFISSNGTVTNRLGVLSAERDIDIQASTLNNVAYEFERRWLGRSSGGFTRCYGGSCRWLTGGSTREFETTTGYTAYSSIEAGRNFTGNFTADIDNETIRQAAGNSIDRQVYDNDVGANQDPVSGVIHTIPFIDSFPFAALFSRNPNSDVIFETRFHFTDLSTFKGSQYFLDNVLNGYDPLDTPKRLGDAYFESQLISQAIFKETGSRYLNTSFNDAATQLSTLIDQGLSQQTDLDLVPGISLSAAQIAALTSDIVWYVEEEYEGQTVLTPQLYLAKAGQAIIASNGALIAANDVTINADRINNSGTVDAQNNVTFVAENDIANTSGIIDAGNDISLTSNSGNIINDTGVFTVATSNGGTIDQQRSTRGNMTAGGSISAQAGKNFINANADMNAQDDISVTVGGDVFIGAQTLHTHREIDEHNTKNHYQSTAYINESRGSNVTAGGDLKINAINDVTIQGSNLAAGNDINVSATLGDVSVIASVDTYDETFKDEKNGFNKVKGSGTIQKKNHTGSTLTSGGDTTLNSTAGNVTLQASEVDSGGDINLEASNGSVNVLAAKDRSYQQESRSKSSAAWVSARDGGAEHETIRHTILTGEGTLYITAADGVTVQYKQTGNLSEDIAQLSQAPGLAWMADLQNDPNVNWQGLSEVHREWHNESEGLGGPAAAVIAIAIAIATNGVGSGLVGATSATGIAASNAAFSALVAQAGVSAISNKGDLGAVFNDLASASTVRSVAAAALTAGLLNEAGVANLDNSSDFFAAEHVVDNIADQLLAAGIRTGVDSTISGANLSDSLKTNLRFAGAAVIGAQLSQEIGIEFAKNEIDPATGINRGVQLIAHTALGCAVGSIGTGNCGAGAAAQLAGEISGLLYDGATQEDFDYQTAQWKERGVDLARLSGALAAAVAGGDAADVNLGSDTGGTAAANNALCGGLCVAAAVAALATAYAASQGGGDIAEGFRVVGRGDDPLTQAMDSIFDVTTDGIGQVAADYLPETTEAAAGYIILAGEAGSDALTFIDESTGRAISTTYEKIPVEYRELIAGVVATGSYAAGGAGAVTKVSTATAKTLGTVAKGGVVKQVGLVGKFDDILNLPKGQRPDPSSYLSQSEINRHLANFDSGVTKIYATSPDGTIGPPSGTFVLPSKYVDNLISQSNGNVRSLEQALGLNVGALGSNPVRVDIKNPQGLRMPSGNEAGANSFWRPGGYTSGNIPEAVIDPIKSNNYTSSSIFNN